MHQISFFGDVRVNRDRLRQQLASLCEIEFKPVESSLDSKLGPFNVFDINLNDAEHILKLRDKLKARSKDTKIIFVTDKASRLQETQAFAIGATDIIHRPVDARTLLTKLWSESQFTKPAGEPQSLADEKPEFSEKCGPGVAAASDMLRGIFSAACAGTPPDSTAIQSAGDAVVGQVEAQGLTAWIDTVRAHHSQTYQHCLLVTGLAVAFGQQLGVSRADRQRLSFAGMLHDIGKARIPLAILEKPGPLDESELAVMRKHPQYGLDALGTVSGLPAEMLDMVVHHHEYLDGSGYPHGLSANEISDLVRIITISDVFGALIERRSYKPPLTGDAAYDVLTRMGPKLDKDLVRAFRSVAKLGQ
jgi:putative nucleotidyltransferase with HDIG domain